MPIAAENAVLEQIAHVQPVPIVDRPLPRAPIHFLSLPLLPLALPVRARAPINWCVAITYVLG